MESSAPNKLSLIAVKVRGLIRHCCELAGICAQRSPTANWPSKVRSACALAVAVDALVGQLYPAQNNSSWIAASPRRRGTPAGTTDGMIEAALDIAALPQHTLEDAARMVQLIMSALTRIAHGRDAGERWISLRRLVGDNARETNGWLCGVRLPVETYGVVAESRQLTLPFLTPPASVRPALLADPAEARRR